VTQFYTGGEYFTDKVQNKTVRGVRLVIIISEFL